MLKKNSVNSIYQHYFLNNITIKFFDSNFKQNTENVNQSTVFAHHLMKISKFSYGNYFESNTITYKKNFMEIEKNYDL